MKRIRSVKLRGKRIRVVWRNLAKEDVLGLAHQDQALIEMDTNMDEKLTTDTLIHEALHVCLPDFDEDAINEIAADIATMLDRADLIKTEDQ